MSMSISVPSFVIPAYSCLLLSSFSHAVSLPVLFCFVFCLSLPKKWCFPPQGMFFAPGARVYIGCLHVLIEDDRTHHQGQSLEGVLAPRYFYGEYTRNILIFNPSQNGERSNTLPAKMVPCAPLVHPPLDIPPPKGGWTPLRTKHLSVHTMQKSWPVSCCRMPKALGYTLTCFDVDGVMHMMQISKIHNALHPITSFLPAPTAEQGHCKICSCGPT